MTASLDHVMWFHRPCRADEWLLYHCHSPAAAAARGSVDRWHLPPRRPAVHHDRTGRPHAAGALTGCCARDAVTLGSRRPPLRHRHHADAGDAARHRRRRSRRRRVRRGPDGAPARVARGRAPRQGGRALRAVGDDGEPARAPVARPGRYRGPLRRAGPRVPLRARRRRGEHARAAPAPSRCRRPVVRRRHRPRPSRRSCTTCPRSPRCRSRTRTCPRAAGRGARPSSTR